MRMSKQTITTIIGIIVLVIIVALVVRGQGGDDSQTADDSGGQTASEELGQDKVTLGIPPWPGARVKSHVVAKALEQQGYDTEIKELDPAPLYTALSNENIDVNVAGWLPTTHQSYWDEHSDNLDIAGINVTETWLGLGVPSYTDESIQSIEDLQGESEFGESVNYEITGIGDGAGITKNTKKALEQYGLKDQWSLKTSSSSAMLTAVQDSMSNEEPIIATVWKPHSAFSLDQDIRQLEDPEGVYNDAEATREFVSNNASDFATDEVLSSVKSDVLATVVYQGFEDDAPAAYKMFNNFRVPASTQSDWIYQLSVEERDPEQIAEDYIDNNQDMVDSWMP